MPHAIVDLSGPDLEPALPALVDLLQACVADGASIGWPTTPAAETAAAFWRRCAAGAASGERRFWIARADAADPASVLGSVQLLLDMPPNGRHRADVVKLMVHPRARRQGLAEALLRHLEAQARQHGRSLLVLDTLSGSDAQRLYQRLGWQLCGQIPGYAQLSDGRLEATTVMFKTLA
jgi:ribosomal protein S18 acetylase RimI-like enzyme